MEEYTSDLPAEKREDVEAQFRRGSVKILVATIALGMGFDKADIHTVIHLFTPSSPVQYYQEIGRAGRKLDLAYAYILPSTPWRNDYQRDIAMNRIFDLLRENSNFMAKDDLLTAAEEGNVKKTHIEDALLVGKAKGYFFIVYDNVQLLRGVTEEEKRNIGNTLKRERRKWTSC